MRLSAALFQPPPHRPLQSSTGVDLLLAPTRSATVGSSRAFSYNIYRAKPIQHSLAWNNCRPEENVWATNLLLSYPRCTRKQTLGRYLIAFARISMTSN